MIFQLSPDFIGCVQKQGYGFQKRQSTIRISPIKGRPRYKLKDNWAPYKVSAVLELSPAQFSGWQDFWNKNANKGEFPFLMRLRLGSLDVWNYPEWYVVRLLGSWQATHTRHSLWQVNMELEVASGVVIATLCDVIYGGPINDLSADDIYGGPITNLASDIVAPCEGVLGDG